jgi:hypothetical protein
LPRSIHRTGLWWVAAAVVLVTLAKVVFGPARRSLGVAVTVWDDAVVGWLAGLHLPGLTGLMEAIVGLPRVFRTTELVLFHAASCWFRYSSRASCGVR